MRRAARIFFYVFMLAVAVAMCWRFKSKSGLLFAAGALWPLVISTELLRRWHSLSAWLWVAGTSLLYAAWILYSLGMISSGVTHPLTPIGFLFMGFYAAPVFCIFWGFGYALERWRRRLLSQTAKNPAS